MPVARFPEVLVDLRNKILDGTFPAGDPLPHTEVLTRVYGVSRQVITNVMRELKEEGLVWRVANRGMIVQPLPVAIEIAMAIERRDESTAWATACRQAGVSGQLTPTPPRQMPAHGEVAQALRLDVGAPVMGWEAWGEIADCLACFDRTYVLKDRYDTGTFDVERSSGTVDLRTRVRSATSEEAAAFRVSLSSPLLDLTRITYDHTGQPLQLLRRLLNPQRVHIVDQRLPLTAP